MENKNLRILAIGDFHGKIPKGLKNRIRNVDFDLIISPGDFSGVKDARKLLAYEHKLYRKYGGDFRKLPKDVKQDAIKRYDKWNKEALNNSERVIRWLRSLKKPVYFVHGNWDFLEKERKKITKRHLGMDELKGNLHFIHKKRVALDNFTILGLGGYRVTSIKEYLPQKTKGKKIPRKVINRIKRKWQKRIKRIFKNQGGNLIFLVHDCPYNTKLDYLKSQRIHIGERLFSEAIKKYHPLLVVCGHMHENQGSCRIGNTIVINAGAAYEGKATSIELEGKKIKGLRFFR